MTAADQPLISVVSPLYNESENVNELVRRLQQTLADQRYEIVLVDDGSTDDTAQLVTDLAARHPQLQLLRLSRNFGHQAAITAGIEHAQGDVVVVMDADLQDPPEVIPQFLAYWQQGYKVVYAIRKQRKESALKRTAYATFYRILRRLSYLDIPLDSGDFALMDRKVVDILNHLPERNRFVRGIRTWVGFRQIGVEYERQERAAGEPKYTFRKLLKLAYDGVISFSHLPLRLMSAAGFILFLLAFVGIIVVLYIRIFMPEVSVPGFATTATVILFLGGIQLLAIGILGEYIARIFDEVKARPNYVVAERINMSPPQESEPTPSEPHAESTR